MNIEEKALEMHACGFNCAQCVLSSLSEYTKLDEKTALAISAGFGGGLRSGEVCGAISGGVMALGLAFPFTDGGNAESKQKIAALAAELVSKAKEEYGSVRCAELKPRLISCGELIKKLAEITEEMIKSN